MKKLILSTVFLLTLILSVNGANAQSDVSSETVLGVTGDYGITPEERVIEQNRVNIERNIPQSLSDQLEVAKQNDDYDEVQRIQNIIDTEYNNGVNVVRPGQYINEDKPLYPTGSTPPYNQDWQGSDILVRTFTGQNYQPRTMDMVMAEDGNMYLAFCTDETTNRFIRVYRSSNSGLNWTLVGGLQSSGYISSISMVCDRRSVSDNDSLRVICYYTRAAATNNDGAVLAFVSFKPNATSADYIIQTIETPAAGNEFNYCSAVSDGQYFSTATYQGVVAGEYNNALDDLVDFHYLRTTNWGSTHTGVTFLGGNDDFFPSAQFVGRTGDSVFIAVERRFSATHYEIRLVKTPFAPTASANTEFLTSGGAGVKYEKPVLNVRQTSQSNDHNMIITCTKDLITKYLSSVNNGGTWGLDFTLGPATQTALYTWVSSDTSTAGGGYFCALWRDTNGDSINVRRGINGSMGTTAYDVMSNQATSTAFPVSAVYHNSDYSVKRSSVGIYGFGGFGTNAYFNAENLPTSIEPINNIATEYKLNQNYPNPFNPTTNIEFSVPKSGLVKVVVFDALGKEVATLVNSELQSGTYNVDFSGANLSSGVYFYKLTTDGFSDIKKMMLIK